MSKEPQLFGADYKGLHAFASTLTERVRELDKKECNFEILPQQSTEILTSMIENYVYAAVNLILAQKKSEASHD